MARYYKLINGFMLNFYDLDLTEEEALAQGYKTANEPPQDGQNYFAKSLPVQGFIFRTQRRLS